MTTVSAVPNAATTNNIGQAEAYRTAIIFSHSPGGNAAPPWLANLTANVQQIANDVAFLRQRADELPIILANSQTGPRGPLYNPTLMAQGWAPLLAAPNPRTRDELLVFTGDVIHPFSVLSSMLIDFNVTQPSNVWFLPIP
jgi:hypothetical protein